MTAAAMAAPRDRVIRATWVVIAVVLLAAGVIRIADVVADRDAWRARVFVAEARARSADAVAGRLSRDVKRAELVAAGCREAAALLAASGEANVKATTVLLETGSPEELEPWHTRATKLLEDARPFLRICAAP